MVSDNTPLVIALVAENENQALETASIGLGYYFEKQYRHCIINLYQPDATRQLLEILKKDNIALVYGMAGTGSQLHLDDGRNLWTAARVPFAALWHDHPCYNWRQHVVNSPYVFHCYHVRDHFEARQKYLPAATSRSVLLPAPYETNVDPAPITFAQREKRIMYAKTALSPQKWAEDWNRHPEQLQKTLWTLVEQALADHNIDLADTTKAQFVEQGVNDFNLLMDVVQEVDVYVRAWRSDKLARALLPHPANIIGRGWDYLADEPRKAQLLSPIPSIVYWHKIHEYRIVANSSPLWRDGIHERAWTGMIAGNILLTDRTEKSDRLFGGLRNYIGFDWGDDLQDVIATALRLADNVDVDYGVKANKTLRERASEGLERYITLLVKIAEEMHTQL